MNAQGRVHFCGSIRLDNEEHVFRSLAQTVGDRAKRYPDGETGGRERFIRWQERVIEDHPQFERVTEKDLGTGGDGAKFQRGGYRLRDGVKAEDLSFGPLGYAEEAIKSFGTFQRLKDGGVIPASVRFQVSLPTPMCFVSAFLMKAERARVEPAYEEAMKADLNAIFAAIPHDQLAIQWDVAYEVFCHDGAWELYYDNDLEESAKRLCRISSYVPDAIELGIHLCYGDAGHKHMIEPKDTSTLLALSNLVSAGAPRPVNWIHMPVPRDRDDDEYFAPLNQLNLRPETELYLGLVHFTDGIEGAARRLAAARRHVTDFGVATECGFGRRDPETIPELLQLHVGVAELQLA